MAFTNMCKNHCPAQDDGEDEAGGLTEDGQDAQRILEETFDGFLENAAERGFKQILSQDPIGKRYTRWIQSNEERWAAWEALDARARNNDREQWAASQYQKYKDPLRWSTTTTTTTTPTTTATATATAVTTTTMSER